MVELEQILKKIRQLGWNLYETSEKSGRDTLGNIVEKGPARLLKYNQLYLILPRVSHPFNIEEVGRAMKALPSSLCPNMTYNGREIALLSLHFCQDYVQVDGRNVREAVRLPPQDFYQSLDTLPALNN